MTLGATITPKEVLDTYFLETRAKLLEIAATLDRVDRAGGGVGEDARMEFIREALKVLESAEAGGGGWGGAGGADSEVVFEGVKLGRTSTPGDGEHGGGKNA